MDFYNKAKALAYEKVASATSSADDATSQQDPSVAQTSPRAAPPTTSTPPPASGTPTTPAGGVGGAATPVKKVSLDTATPKELQEFVVQQAAHIKKLEGKCISLITHFKKATAEKKSLLQRFNDIAARHEKATEQLEAMQGSDAKIAALEKELQQTKAAYEEERGAARELTETLALERDVKERLVDQFQTKLKDLERQQRDQQQFVAEKDSLLEKIAALEARESERQSLANANSTMTKEMHELKMQLAQKAEEAADFKAKAADLTARTEDLKLQVGENEAVQNSNVQLSKQVEELKKKLSESSAASSKQVEELRKKLSESDAASSKQVEALKKKLSDRSVASPPAVSTQDADGAPSMEAPAMDEGWGDEDDIEVFAEGDLEVSFGPPSTTNTSGEAAESASAPVAAAHDPELLERVQAEHQHALEEAQQQHERQLQEHGDVFRQKMADVQKQHQVSLEETQRSAQEKIQQTKAHHVKLMDAARVEIQRQLEEFQAEKEALTARRREADQAAQDEKKKRMDAENELATFKLDSRSELENSAQEKISYMALLKEKGSKLEAIQRELEATSSKLSQLESTQSDERQHAGAVQQENEKLKAQLSQQQAALDDAQQKLAEIQAQMQQSTSSLEARAHEALALNKRLRQELTEERASAEQRELQSEQWKADMTAAQQESIETRAELSALRDRLSEANIKAETAQHELEKVQQKLNDANAAAAAKPAEKEASAGDSADNGKQAEEGSEERIKQEEVNRLKALLSLAKQHLSDARQRAAKSAEALLSERKLRVKAEREVEDAKGDKHRQQSHSDRHQSELNELRRSVALLRAKCKEFSKDASVAQEDLRVLRLKIQAAESLPKYSDSGGGAGTTAAGGGGDQHNQAVIAAIRQECDELRESVLELNDRNLSLVARAESADLLEKRNVALEAEIADIRAAVAETRDAERALKDEMRVELEAIVAGLRAELNEKAEELTGLEQETSQKFEELTEQLRRYRSRTKKVIEQKDLTILQLKKQKKSAANLSSSSSAAAAGAVASTVEELPVVDLPPSDSEMPAGVLPMSELSLQDARSQIQRLSSVVRDHKQVEGQYQQQISALKRRVDEFERDANRQGRDSQYLKNIVLKYMSDRSEETHESLKPVLTMLLQFNQDELEQMERQRGGGNGSWWNILSPAKGSANN